MRPTWRCHSIQTTDTRTLLEGWCTSIRRALKGIPYIEQAMRLDPAQQQYRHFLGTAYLVAGNYKTAAAILKERVAITPTTDLSRALLASALGHLGRTEEARQIWRELKEINPRYSYSDDFGRLPFKNPTDADQLTEGLRKAGW